MRRSRLGISHATVLLALAAGVAGCQVEGNGLSQATPMPSGGSAPVGGGAGGAGGSGGAGPPPFTPPAADAGSTGATPPNPPVMGGTDAQGAEPDAGPGGSTMPPPPPPADASVPADVTPTQPPPQAACNRLPAGPFQARQREESPSGDDITFDMDGHLVGFAGNDLVRLQGRNAEIIARNIVTPRGGGAVRVMADGEIIVADYTRDRLVRIDPQTGREGVNMAVRSPMKMAIGPGRRVYVTSRDGAIYRVEPGRDNATVAAELRARLGGITFSPDFRTLYVGATDDNSIHAFSVDAQGNLGRPLLWSARAGDAGALATDECGNVYVRSNDGRLVRIDASGNVSPLADVRGQDASALAFGSGKHGWSAEAIYVLDFSRGVIIEIPVGVRSAPLAR
jgi:hypothetical protein